MPMAIALGLGIGLTPSQGGGGGGAPVGPAIGTVSGYGDSIMSGGDAAINNLGYSSPDAVTILDFGVPGQLMQRGYSRLLNGEFDSSYSTDGVSVGHIQYGTNDLANIGGSTTATTLYKIATAFVALVKSKGIYAVLWTISPRILGGVDDWNSDQEAQRVAYNALVIANAAGADGIADINGIAALSDPSNATNYIDGLHPTAAGQLLRVPTVRAATEAVIHLAARPPYLKALGLSGALAVGAASSGTITNATAGSTIVSNIAGLTVNSGARTYSWSGSGSPGPVANALVETLAGRANSPASSTLHVTDPAVASYLRLSPIVMLSEAADGGGYSYTATGGVTSYNNQVSFARSPLSLAEGADGWIELELNGVGASGPILGFSTSATPNDYGAMDTAIYADANAGSGYGSLGGGTVSPQLMEAGDRFRLRRAGDTIYGEVSKDGGGSWLTQSVKTGATTAKLYVIIQACNGASSGVVKKPRHLGLT